MAIEITGRTGSPAPITPPPKSVGEGENKVAVSNPAQDDSIALTQTTQEIKKAVGASSKSSVDIDRVNSVKKALADGSYSVNAEKVAQKLIQFEKLMPPGDSS